MAFELGVDEAAVARIADGDPEEVTARVAWTCIIEPGDRVAGTLIATYGAVGALRIVASEARSSSVESGLADPKALDEFRRALLRWRPRLTQSAVDVALAQAPRFDTRLVLPGTTEWPRGFDDLDGHAPIALWVRGTRDALLTLDRSIALVGARAATGYGEHVTMEASAGLVDRGYTIVSGAAYGIDGMAHRAALASHGQTVAFLAGGVDRFYPSGHDALLTRIAEVGAVVSELPCGQAPTKWRFLQRNRLIAAASRATVVLEAGWRSGSLNTAGHAATLGRPLGAVPGPVTSAASAGCHRLIRDYTAICVTNPDEMAELSPLETTPALFADASDPGSPSSDLVRLYDALSSRSPRTAADIAARSGLSIAEVQGLLGALELEGEVAVRERGWVRVTRG